MDLRELKSGTDIRGSAVGEDIQLNDENIHKIALAFLEYAAHKKNVLPQNMCIAVGHDSRISAERIKSALTAVFFANGVTVYDCGLASTPAMFMTTVMLPVTASVQITASHHPYDKNGLKFFTSDGSFEGSEIAEILELAQKKISVDTCKTGNLIKTDFMSAYSELLRDKIKKEVYSENYEKPLTGFHIAVDAGNGAGGFYARDVLEKLGADISGSQFLDPDGYFPNHIPNPENQTAMAAISRAVTENSADLGVIFDTDVDRAACVGADGKEINRNRLIALSSVIALEKNPGGTIVTDSVTSDGLKDFINNHLGGDHHRFCRGYKNVINEAKRLNNEGINCPLAIETSGHAALRDNYFLDDGAYLITEIIILAAKLRRESKNTEELIACLKEPAEETELRFKINAPDFRSYGTKVITELADYCKQFGFITPADDNAEGYRISFDRSHGDGWLLLRLSVHDPILPLNFESNVTGGNKIMAEFFYEFISKYDLLDITPIKEFLNI